MWTAEEIPDQTGRTAIVTGANTGIGYPTARALAVRGADVVLACRSPERGEEAAARIRGEGVPGEVAAMELDLADLASVRAFATAFRDRGIPLHLLINNAGIMMTPYGETADGFEQQMGVNHLGHFALTGLLLDALGAADRARVVTVSSNAHRMGRMDFDDLMFEQGGYSPARAYGRSKLANLLFTRELQRRFRAVGSTALAVAAHPGYATTELTRYLEDRWAVRLLLPLFSWVAQSAEMGALPTLRAAVDPAVEAGAYYGPGGFMEQRGYPVPVAMSGAARDLDTAARLWEISERLTGVTYDFSSMAGAGSS